MGHVEERIPRSSCLQQVYHSMGFDVFSVSLDSDINRWKGAIEQDGLVGLITCATYKAGETQLRRTTNYKHTSYNAHRREGRDHPNAP